MKFILSILLLVPGLNAEADTFILTDGTRLEGEVTGDTDGELQVKTKYGPLTINKTAIQERQTAPAVVPAPAPAELPAAPPGTVAASTSAPEIELSTAQPGPAAAPAPKLTFLTLFPSTMTRQLVYLESGVAIATETFDAGGALLLTEGAIGNGTYTEYYPDGGLKTVKTMIGGKANGTLKAFYPSGALQLEVYYLAGGKEGPFRYHTSSGKLLMEASYKNDLLNGWKKEYGADGAVSAETYYVDDRASAPEKKPSGQGPAAAAAAEPESLVTVKVVRFARGELLSFRLNDKYIGKAQLDKDFNIISQEGKVPDGAVKVYSEDGKLQKELLFLKNAIITLRAYAPGGPLRAEYHYTGNKAVKKD